jgi:hypothetical protein
MDIRQESGVAEDADSGLVVKKDPGVRYQSIILGKSKGIK